MPGRAWSCYVFRHRSWLSAHCNLPCYCVVDQRSESTEVQLGKTDFTGVTSAAEVTGGRFTPQHRWNLKIGIAQPAGSYLTEETPLPTAVCQPWRGASGSSKLHIMTYANLPGGSVWPQRKWHLSHAACLSPHLDHDGCRSGDPEELPYSPPCLQQA